MEYVEGPLLESQLEEDLDHSKVKRMVSTKASRQDCRNFPLTGGCIW